MATIQMNQLREWIGRTELQSDQITPVPIAALAATLDRNDPFPRAGDAYVAEHVLGLPRSY